MIEIIDLQNDIFGPLSLKLDAGQSLVIEGASGSGKTRFLRAVADLDAAAGQVLLNGEERGAMPAEAWRRRVRLVPATSHWWDERVAAHFSDPLKLKETMPRLGLAAGLAEADVNALSTGELQRLAFLRAIEDKPEVLLLDEPTSALDQEGTVLLEAMIDAEIARGAIVFLVSHSREQREKYGPEGLVFDGGRAVFSHREGAVS